MQVAYKTINVTEFDALSGSYKQSQKQVEDLGFSKFLEQTSMSEEVAKISNENLQQEPDFKSSLYALRFRQDEEALLLKTKEQNSAPNLLQDLF